MATFRYKAIDEAGAEVAGALVADTAEEARARLRAMRLYPESVKPAARQGVSLRERLPGRKLRAATHVAIFTRQFAVLLTSGVTVVEALRVLARQTEDRALSLALSEIAESVNAGRSLAEAMSGYPQLFDRSYVGMVASGEKSGTMDAVFMRLAEFLERRRLMQARASNALIYPGILVAMAFSLLMFLSGYVVPAIKPLLAQHRRPLPLSTMALFAVGDAVRSGWWAVLLVALAGAAWVAWFRRDEHRRATMDMWLLRAPLVGRIWLKSIVARLAMSFAALLRTGVPAVEALEVLERTVPNAAFAREIARIREEVTGGKDISSRMQRSALFPPMVAYMVSVGERSGNLADALEHVANAYDMEVEIASRRLLAALEPALVLAMAGVVGFIAASLMTTILELSRI